MSNLLCLAVAAYRLMKHSVPVGRCDEARGRKLRVETIFGHQHQVRKTTDDDAGADILQRHREVRQLQTTRQGVGESFIPYTD